LTRRLRRFLALMAVVFPLAVAAEALAQDSSSLTPAKTGIEFDLGASRAPQQRSVLIETSAVGTTAPEAELVSELSSTESPLVIPETAVSLDISEASGGEAFKLNVTLAPTLGGWHAGEYSTSIRVGGEGYESATIPLSATFKGGPQPWGWVAAAILIAIGVLVGLLFKTLEAKDENPAGTRADAARKAKSKLSRWSAKRGPVLTGIITALVIVLAGVNSEYLAEDTFGVGGFGDWLKLVFWGFAAGFSGKTISDYATSKVAQ
jgi:hypothetical protein